MDLASMNNNALAANLPGKTPKYFTVLQAIILSLATIILTSGIWYGVWYFYSDHMLDQKRIDAQLEYYKKQVEIDPNKVENHINLGYTYFLKKDDDRAVNEFNKVLEINKNFWGAYYNLGLVYDDQNRLDDSLEMFKKATELNPRDGKSFLQLGIAYRKLKMYDNSLSALTRADRLLQGNVEVIYQIGQLAEAEGKKQEAIQIYKDALRFDPLYKDAADALKRLQ